MMNPTKIATMCAAVCLILFGAGCIQHTSPLPTADTTQTTTTSKLVGAIQESHCLSNGAISECFSSPEKLRDAIYEETQLMETSPAEERYYGKPQPIRFSGHPKAWEFRTLLRQGEARGPNAAGRYTIISILMTGWGARTWIVDAKTGEILLEDEVAPCGWRYSIESSVIIKDPVEGGCSMAGSPTIWKVRNGKLENQGPHLFGEPEQY